MEREEVARLGQWAVRLVGETLARAGSELDQLVPPESRVHLLKAQHEVLLAAAAAVEHRRHPKGSKSQRRRARKIVLD
jgi:hypothetical protein